MYYPIQLDKMRNLKYGMKAIHILEKTLKKAFTQMDTDEMTMEELSIFIWAGLQHEDKDLTPDKVMDIIDDYSSLQDVLDRVGEAIQQQFGSGSSSPIEETQDSEKNV